MTVEKVQSVKALGGQAWQTELEPRVHMKKSDVVTQIHNPSTGDGRVGKRLPSQPFWRKSHGRNNQRKTASIKEREIAPSKCCSLTL